MPFLSKDWRSPGEEWVKTEEGWEMKKILRFLSTGSYHESLSGSPRLSLCSENKILTSSDSEEDDNTVTCLLEQKDVNNAPQPYCQITIKCTREIAGFNGLSEACKRLDFRGAVRDARRFNYICKLLDLLITQNLTTLSGCAQKVLFTMLEEVAQEVMDKKQNMHLLQKLLADLQRALMEYYCWGRPVGSTPLWDHHKKTIQRINNIANKITIPELPDTAHPKLTDLPPECMREIMIKIADHRDIERMSEAYPMARGLSQDEKIWKKLCKYHFTRNQIEFLLSKEGQILRDWHKIYHKLRKMYGLREEYAEMLALCRSCRCLYWQSSGHPCMVADNPEYQEKLQNNEVDPQNLTIAVPPGNFLKFFSL